MRSLATLLIVVMSNSSLAMDIQFEGCVITLTAANMNGTDAANFCTQNATIGFQTCVGTLSAKQMTGLQAGNFCMEDSSINFQTCVSTSNRTGADAGNACLIEKGGQSQSSLNTDFDGIAR